MIRVNLILMLGDWVADKQTTRRIGDGDSGDEDFRKESQSLRIDKHLIQFEDLVQETPTRWANLCVDNPDEGSIGEQEFQVTIPNTLVLAAEAMVNPLLVHGCDVSVDAKNCLVKEKMFEIVGLLRIAVEGRVEETRAYIRGMFYEEFGSKNIFGKLKEEKEVEGD